MDARASEDTGRPAAGGPGPSSEPAGDPLERSGPSAAGASSIARLFRVISGIAVGLGFAQGGVGALQGEWRAVLLGVAGIGYGLWVLSLIRGMTADRRDAAATRISVGTLVLLAVSSGLQPSMGTALAIGSLLPAVIVVPIVSTRILLRLLILSGLTGAWCVLAETVIPPNTMPQAGQTAMAFLALVFAYAFLIIFLWEVSRQLKGTAADLRSVVAMSSDLAETLDPRLVGDRIAVHIARAVGADDCALSFWDRATDRVVTLGYHPPARRETLNESYPVDAFPATRAVLHDQRSMVIEADDPTADEAEVAYLASIRQRTMAMIPLIAAGRTVGLVEVTSARQGTFDARAVELATMLAGEAAMALENARLYEEIRHQALHDGLTGLANRVLFRDRVEHAVERNRRAGGQIAVLFVDLDDFKTLNDSHGHARGDEVLAIAAGRVRDVLRPSDTAARLGGDEFAILIEDIVDEADALAVATRLADALRQPIAFGPVVLRVAASIGVAIGGPTGETADDLLRNADVAMYAAKGSSRGGAEVFRPALRDGAAERADLAGRLRGIEERGELRIDYQPIVALATNRIESVEALVRWQPPDGPVLMPNEWIDLAEDSGDIVGIGRWVLREACRQTRDWQIRLGRPDLQISVNLSARQFREHDIVATVRSALEDTGLPAGTLMLEITESGLMRRTQSTIARLDALRALGVHLALDDFGTGYSSLSYLERFPIDTLKIDRSFVSSNGVISPIARAIVDLGRTLGLEVIAEGIEHLDQARWLAELGCRYGQGYLFARPMSATALESVLAEGDGILRPAEPESTSDAGRDDGPRLRVVGEG